MNTLIRSTFILSMLTSSCANLSSKTDRIWMGASIGGVAGAGAGALLTPNEESRGMNAIVFGLSGALAGAIAGILTGPNQGVSQDAETLETRERKKLANVGNEYLLGPKTKGKSLPEFLRRRITPAIVEEYVEQDLVGEDGTLHSPHKVYRIKRQAELFARPKSQSQSEK